MKDTVRSGVTRSHTGTKGISFPFLLQLRNLSVVLSLFLIVMLLGVLAGCKQAPESRRHKPGTPVKADPQSPALETPSMAKVHVLDIGDVEAKTRVELTIDSAFRSEQFQVNEMRDLRKKLAMVNATITPPFPEQLPLVLDLSVYSDFSTTPIIVKGTLLRDKQPVDHFYTILGQNTKRPPVQDASWPLEFTLDAFKDLDTLPDTFLLHAELEIILMPEGTDEAMLAPQNIEAADKESSIILSNPIRIDLKKEDVTP